MKIILQLDTYLRQRLFKKVTQTTDYIAVVLDTMEVLLSFWHGNLDDCRAPYIFYESEERRIYLVDVDKIISFGFLFNIKLGVEDVNAKDNYISKFQYRVFDFDPKNISQAKSILKNVSDKDSLPLYCYESFNFDENDGVDDYSRILFEQILFTEAGYFRYDHDGVKSDPVFHPRHHIDVNYSHHVSYKIGISNKLDLTQIRDLVNKKSQCRYLK